MMHKPSQGRRDFLKLGATVAGTAVATSVVMSGASGQAAERPRKANRLPREVWIATIAQEGLRANTPQEMAKQFLQRMAQAAKVEPDVICLPEIFCCSNLSKSAPPIAEVAEEGLGPLLKQFSQFANEHHCYVVCPVYTKHQGKFYNAAVFLDRKGEILGEYQKTYATISEIEAGVTPGPLKPSVFTTDFGKVGAQICFDICWDMGWHYLRDAGAEIVFWPSAFAGGRSVQSRAYQNHFCVVSSTNKDESKICDITGETVAATSRWHNWVCAPVNLEKVFMHTWPYVSRFGDITNKYGDRVRITTFPYEEWSIIESRDPGVRIADVMKEFELLSITDHLKAAEQVQNKHRA